MNTEPQKSQPQQAQISSTLLGALAVLCVLLVPFVLALATAATFWAFGVARYAYFWMVGAH